jgi:hypothetical protein
MNFGIILQWENPWIRSTTLWTGDAAESTMDPRHGRLHGGPRVAWKIGVAAPSRCTSARGCRSSPALAEEDKQGVAEPDGCSMEHNHGGEAA